MIYLPTMINSSHEKIVCFFVALFNMLRMDFKPNYVTIIIHMRYIDSTILKLLHNIYHIMNIVSYKIQL